MTEFEALVLGLIQGLTEFLPVSSSGHLELGNFFLGVSTSNNLLFAIIVHGATALSTIVIFRKEIGEILNGLLRFERNEASIYTSKILLSIVPVGIIGVLFEKEIEAFFSGNVVFVAFMLIITGILLSITSLIKIKEGEVTYGRAVLIGIAQALAILPGISRSGATISTALMVGVEKSRATRFSFLMVLVPILGVMLLKVKDLIENPELAEGIGINSIIIGFFAAFISGLIACRWMIKIVKKGKLIYFAIYCFVVATAVLIAYW
jgi:undecaprenyl-diphosphatase